jgi:hypothetical protein
MLTEVVWQAVGYDSDRQLVGAVKLDLGILMLV